MTKVGTPFRPELSKKNPYYIPSHRFYELRHRCLLYYQYKKWLKDLDLLYKHWFTIVRKDGSTWSKDPTGDAAAMRERLTSRIETVEKACEEADPSIAKYLLIGITEGASYEVIRVRYDIPCSRDYYYSRYHKVFWLLHMWDLKGIA